MTYYHATESHLAEQIAAEGLRPNKARATVKGWQYDGEGVYLFASIEAAQEYGYLNFSDIAIFAVSDIDPDDLVEDLEYDDQSSWILSADEAPWGVDADQLNIAYQTQMEP